MTVSIDSNCKSTLPPRKRARTNEEKEQRRVERIMRNRRAAHASREKKRKHVENLETYVLQLENCYATLSSNFKRVCGLVPAEQLKLLELPSVEDLSSLKGLVHESFGSMNNTRCRLEAPRPMEFGGTEEPAKRETLESPKLLASSSGYFNYLSPVSINSPLNSPLDLTLKPTECGLPKMPEFSVPSLTASSPSALDTSASEVVDDSPISGLDFLVQNSAVVLYREDKFGSLLCGLAGVRPRLLFSACHFGAPCSRVAVVW